MLALGHLVNISIKPLIVPTDILEMTDTLQGHGNAFQPVSQFDRGHVQRHPTSLLKVGKLCNFLAVQPHFPTQAPGGKRRRFPVVFNEANIMLFGIYP